MHTDRHWVAADKESPVHTVLHHRVRYHEADAQGILFNSRYLELADVAMTEYFRFKGLPYLEMVAGGMDPAVGSAKLRFIEPARFEDVLEVRAQCTRVGTSSFDLSVKVLLDDRTIAELTMSYVNIDSGTAQSRALPSGVAQILAADLDGAEETSVDGS
jgi:acyl-CoA thioester hydrolase